VFGESGIFTSLLKKLEIENKIFKTVDGGFRVRTLSSPDIKNTGIRDISKDNYQVLYPNIAITKV